MKKLLLALSVIVGLILAYKVYVFGRDMYKINNQYGWYWRSEQ